MRETYNCQCIQLVSYVNPPYTTGTCRRPEDVCGICYLLDERLKGTVLPYCGRTAIPTYFDQSINMDWSTYLLQHTACRTKVSATRSYSTGSELSVGFIGTPTRVRREPKFRTKPHKFLRAASTPSHASPRMLNAQPLFQSSGFRRDLVQKQMLFSTSRGTHVLG